MTSERMLFLEFDLAGAEWVVVAYLSGDARMLDIVNSGRSPHVVTGSLISGAPEEIVVAEEKLVGKLTDPDDIAILRKKMPELKEGGYFLPRSMSIRQAGKKSNHGLNYDMRYRRFALENEIEESDAKIIVDKYRTVAYPGIPDWHKSIKAELRKDRTMTNCFGRKVRLLGEWGSDLFDQAYSFKPQSTIVDIINRGMCDAFEDTSPLMMKMDLSNQEHDALVMQYPTDNWDELAEFAVRMAFGYLHPEIEYNYRKFHIGVDLKVGLRRGEGNMFPINLVEDQSVVKQSMLEAWELIREQAA